MKFVLTGFGAFNGVSDNPTTHLVPELAEMRSDIVKHAVLTVGGIDVERFIKDTLADVEADRLCFVHLGVAAGREMVCLERNATNNADFRCPDERGWCPVATPIRAEDGDTSVCLKSQLDVDALAEELAQQEQLPVRVSEDAGEFLCNMIYYISLRGCRDRSGFASLFVHVPLFEQVDKATQLKTLNLLLDRIAAQPAAQK